MKLLLDENLSPRLVLRLASLYPGSDHVHNLNLGGAHDSQIWVYAKTHDFIIVSKDSDFAERSVRDPDSPRIIWILLGNCITTDIEELLRSAHLRIRDFFGNNQGTCLRLGKT